MHISNSVTGTIFSVILYVQSDDKKIYKMNFLRSVQHSVTYMNDNYLTAMKVFTSFHNMQGLKIDKET